MSMNTCSGCEHFTKSINGAFGFCKKHSAPQASQSTCRLWVGAPVLCAHRYPDGRTALVDKGFTVVDLACRFCGRHVSDI